MGYQYLSRPRGAGAQFRLHWVPPLAVASRNHRMGVLVPIATMPSHTCPVDGTSVTAVAVPTPVHCAAWTPETPSLADHALEFDGHVAT